MSKNSFTPARRIKFGPLPAVSHLPRRGRISPWEAISQRLAKREGEWAKVGTALTRNSYMYTIGKKYHLDVKIIPNTNGKYDVWATYRKDGDSIDS